MSARVWFRTEAAETAAAPVRPHPGAVAVVDAHH
jgi:hypothetical protein